MTRVVQRPRRLVDDNHVDGFDALAAAPDFRTAIGGRAGALVAGMIVDRLARRRREGEVERERAAASSGTLAQGRPEARHLHVDIAVDTDMATLDRADPFPGLAERTRRGAGFRRRALVGGSRIGRSRIGRSRLVGAVRGAVAAAGSAGRKSQGERRRPYPKWHLPSFPAAPHQASAFARLPIRRRSSTNLLYSSRLRSSSGTRSRKEGWTVTQASPPSPSGIGWGSPRIREIVTNLPRIERAAVAPKATTTAGRISSRSCSIHQRQASISGPCGLAWMRD